MKLCRSSTDYRLAGICGGLAEQLGWDSGRLRVVWVLALAPGLVLYLALWYLMPKAPPSVPAFDPPPLQPWKKAV
jgi:phage shock protein PspC (stress-responsive transcriptional regulator)